MACAACRLRCCFEIESLFKGCQAAGMQSAIGMQARKHWRDAYAGVSVLECDVCLQAYLGSDDDDSEGEPAAPDEEREKYRQLLLGASNGAERGGGKGWAAADDGSEGGSDDEDEVGELDKI